MNVSSALTLIADSGTATTLLGTLVNLLPVLLLVVCTLGVAAWMYSRVQGRSSFGPAACVSASSAAIIFFTPWSFLVASAAGFTSGLLWPMSTRARDRSFTWLSKQLQAYTKEERLRAASTAFVVGAIICLVLALIIGPTWFVQENVVMTSIPGERTAFVVGTSEEWTTMLDPKEPSDRICAKFNACIS